MKYTLLVILVFLGTALSAQDQSPHGDDFKTNCAACHNADGWEIPADAWDFEPLEKPKKSKMTGWIIPPDTSKFNHFRTDFPLLGQHADVDCRACHESLIFEEASLACISCHTDVHRQTVGNDCIRCHTVDNWLVDNITELHEDNGFPLLGAHAVATCTDCHTATSALEFTRIGNQCVNCHLDEFTATTNPNHVDANFSTNCLDCHSAEGFDWGAEAINHDFFPLEKGHDIQDCAQCHRGGNFADTPTDCASCHTQDFTATVNPNHTVLNLSTDCAGCHTTEPGWSPASFDNHDEFYPLNGAHAVIANDCATCHNGDYTNTPNTCAGCHTEDFNATTNPNHQAAQFPLECESCHTEIAWTPSSFNHDEFYVLDGGHAPIANDCALCHIDGNYANTPNTCVGCHTQDFTETTNPSHTALNLSTDCESCHTTQPDWMPATFDVHDDFYVLNGAHAAIANDCVACHNGDYNNTPTTCFGCHAQDYTNTTNPNHQAAQFSTDCASCHTEVAWEPATFDHDAEFFPIYSGTHQGEWDACVDCHTNPNNYAEFTCITCHTNPQTDNEHNGVGGYVYESNACLACHPTGDADDSFNHDETAFPLTGVHFGVDCMQCHANGFAGTSTECASCHMADFNQTTNPNHSSVGFSTDCATCHTTETDWTTASGFNHDEVHVLNGAHAAIENDCVACHMNGNFANTPNTCAGCHTEDFNATTNPNHQAAQFPLECESCHTEIAWTPSSFNHDEFYVLDGGHAPIANDCALCHIDGNYANTPNTCVGCHTQDFTATVNPSHTALNLSTDCESCHTTQPDWMPATFDVHDDFYALNGAHAAIANDCVACHNGDYNNTPTTCFGCHAQDYTNTTNPNHQAAQFSTDCASCHTEIAWEPATFDHDAEFFPIYSGTHQGEWDACVDCHTNPNNYAEFTCITCHTNPQTDNEHNGVGGYVYESNACLACHPTGDADDGFNHNETAFPLTGVHFGVDCIQCHADGFAGTSTECASCHMADFNQTTNPNHSSVGFSTDCATCHTTETDWTTASGFNHDEVHVLNGAHAAIENDCVACHTNGNFANTPNTCAGCHTEDFNATTNPDHQAAQFPTTCESCHSETAWSPSTFNHDEFYVLNGAHADIANNCNACHINGNYANTPNTCFACHTTDYNQATNPNHQSAGFPTDCESCHNENGWSPSSFDHDSMYFPIYSGNHQNEWTQCSECHTIANNFSVFSCIDCHEHNDPNQLANDHNDVNGYQFESNACYACHPNGESD